MVESDLREGREGGRESGKEGVSQGRREGEGRVREGGSWEEGSQ